MGSKFIFRVEFCFKVLAIVSLTVKVCLWTLKNDVLIFLLWREFLCESKSLNFVVVLRPNLNGHYLAGPVF